MKHPITDHKVDLSGKITTHSCADCDHVGKARTESPCKKCLDLNDDYCYFESKEVELDGSP